MAFHSPINAYSQALLTRGFIFFQLNYIDWKMLELTDENMLRINFPIYERVGITVGSYRNEIAIVAVRRQL